MAFELKSASFEQEQFIGREFTCEGEDVSVGLSWDGAPVETKSFALICDDPDAPVGTWVHWIVYNIPAQARQLPEAVGAREALEDGTRQGLNDFRRVGYGGPCPPPGGPHRYFFRLYALDAMLQISGTATKKVLLEAMEGHILDEAVLMGLYKRGGA